MIEKQLIENKIKASMKLMHNLSRKGNKIDPEIIEFYLENKRKLKNILINEIK